MEWTRDRFHELFSTRQPHPANGAEAGAETAAQSGRAEAGAETAAQSGRAEAGAETTAQSGRAEAGAETAAQSGRAEAGAETLPGEYIIYHNNLHSMTYFVSIVQ